MVGRQRSLQSSRQLPMNMLRRPSVRVILSVALSVMVGVLLIATIYFTRFDLQWLAFLGGVLFAAVLGLVSQA